MFEQLLSVSRNTFLESIRQHIFTVLIIAAAVVLCLNPALAANTLDDDNKLLYDMSLSTLLVTGLLLAGFTAASVITKEIDNKTVVTVVSKPVSRPIFVVGKFLGVAGAMAVAFWILTIVFLLTVRHRVMQTASDHYDQPVLIFGLGAALIAALWSAAGNYWYSWPWTSSFITLLLGAMTAAYALVLHISPEWQFQWTVHEFTKDDYQLSQLSLALILLFQALLIITAVAIAASTRLGQVMTLTISAAAFVLGLLTNTLFGRYAQDNSFIAAIYAVTPNFQYLWIADDLTQGRWVTGDYVLWSTGYSALLVTAVLFVAVALFQSREVG